MDVFWCVLVLIMLLFEGLESIQLSSVYDWQMCAYLLFIRLFVLFCRVTASVCPNATTDLVSQYEELKLWICWTTWTLCASDIHVVRSREHSKWSISRVDYLWMLHIIVGLMNFIFVIYEQEDFLWPWVWRMWVWSAKRLEKPTLPCLSCRCCWTGLWCYYLQCFVYSVRKHLKRYCYA